MRRMGLRLETQRIGVAAALWLGACNGAPSAGPAAAPEHATSMPSVLPATPLPEAPAVAAAEAEPTPRPVSVEQVLHVDETDPLGDLEAADGLQAPEPLDLTRKAPGGGCIVLEAARRVWGAPSPVAVASFGDGFVVAGYTRKAEAERLFLVHVPAEGPPSPLFSLPVEPPHPSERLAPPALSARDANIGAVAFTDGAGALKLREVRVEHGSSAGQVQALASGVDTRFAPALMHFAGRAFVAWTAGTTPMSAELAVVAGVGQGVQRARLNPASHGGAAPSFVVGSEPPELVFVDARDGMSSMLQVALGAEGKAAPPQVVGVVGIVSSPPRLAAAADAIGVTLAYTGLGSAATSAIGLLRLGAKNAWPEALIKGTAYTTLAVSAAAAPAASLFAVDAPLAPGKQPKRHIQLYVVHGTQAGAPTEVAGPAGDAYGAALARSDSGIVGVAFQDPSGVYLTRLRCDDAL
jgi:hypothetical protein